MSRPHGASRPGGALLGTGTSPATSTWGMVWKNPSTGNMSPYLLKQNGQPYRQLGPTKDLTEFSRQRTRSFRSRRQPNETVRQQSASACRLRLYDYLGRFGRHPRRLPISITSPALTVVTAKHDAAVTDHFTNAVNGSDLDRV